MMKKAVAAILAVVMATTMLLMSGCSTPKVAMTVDGVEYTTGEYLAALYQTYYSIYYQQGMYQYAAYGTDPWTQTIPYGDANEQLLLADFMVRTTQDNIIRQTAVAKLMKQYGITVPAADLAEYQKGFADVDEKEMIKYGFSKQSFMRMNMATMEEQELFYSLYSEGGKRAIAAEKLREHFEKSFVAYKAITISQVDGSGNALTDEAKAKNKEKLEKLSNREIEVLKLVSVGMFNKEIGKELDISERTVKNHMSNIFKKIECTDRTQAAVFAIRNGLVNVN